MFRFVISSTDASRADSEPAAKKHSKEETDEGTKLVQEILREWISRTSAANDGDGDVNMDSSADDIPMEKQVEILKSCFEEYRTRLEGNAWCQTLLQTL